MSAPRVIGHLVNTPGGEAVLVDLDAVYALVRQGDALVTWPQETVTAVDPAVKAAEIAAVEARTVTTITAVLAGAAS